MGRPPWLDATVALDDALTERHMACLVCDQSQGVRSLDLVVVNGTPLMVSRCLRCVRQDPAGAQLIAWLAQRHLKPRGPMGLAAHPGA